MQTKETERSVVHSTFSIERAYPVPPSRVFGAFSNQATKRRWFAEGEGWEVNEFSLDFRVGGCETSRFRFKGGALMGNDTVYLDIIPDQRIIFAYTMTVGDKRTSVSLATVEIVPSGSGAHLTYTEQGAFFDTKDRPEGREAGCREMLEKLSDELRNHEIDQLLQR